MLDYCGGPECRTFRVSRSVDSRPLLNRWFCSDKCRDLVSRPIHWVPEDESSSPCSAVWIQNRPWLLTSDLAKVTCGNCKRADIYKRALAAA